MYSAYLTRSLSRRVRYILYIPGAGFDEVAAALCGSARSVPVCPRSSLSRGFARSWLSELENYYPLQQGKGVILCLRLYDFLLVRSSILIWLLLAVKSRSRIKSHQV